MRAQPLAIAALLALSLAAGCKKDAAVADPIPPGLPAGTPVTLNENERDAPATPSMKDWYGWQLKGLQLKKEGRLQEALYCFRQALIAWPKTMPDDVKADVRRAALYKPVATDTQLQLGALFVELGDKKWALYFLDAYDAQLPGNPMSKELRLKALELKQP